MKFFKNTFLLGLTFLIIGLSSNAFAEYYKVSVTRIDQDLYKDSNSGVYIETRFCYVYGYYLEAILKLESFSFGNKLIFENGTTCGVVKVFS